MSLTKHINPKSRIHQWVDILSITETPDSYAIACGLSVIGAAFKRHVYVDQVNWKVYPTLRILLVGPPGIGKDTAINESKKAVEKLGIPIVGGVTKEHIQDQIAKIIPPQTAFIAAGELANFMGRSDYQNGTLEFLTDLFSDPDIFNCSTRSEAERILIKPTITMQAGSTTEWIHGNLPRNALSGGFIPRFLVVPEEYSGRSIAIIKRELSKAQLNHVEKSKLEFIAWLKAFSSKTLQGTPQEMIWDDEGAHTYQMWYKDRAEFFPKTVLPYAQRARDHVLRLAMLHALSRESFCIEQTDVSFAIIFIARIAEKIAEAIIPPTIEAQCAHDVLKLLPKETSGILRALRKKYHSRTIQEAISALKNSKEIVEEAGRLKKL